MYFQTPRLTEDTHSGAPGAHVASNVLEELNNVLVPAQIPDRKTEEKTATGWDPEEKQEFVTAIAVKVNFLNYVSFIYHSRRVKRLYSLV